MVELQVVAYVDGFMVQDADDVPRHEDGRTLYVSCLNPEEDAVAAFGPEWAWVDEVRGIHGDTRRWFLFDREATDGEKHAAARKYLVDAGT